MIKLLTVKEIDEILKDWDSDIKFQMYQPNARLKMELIRPYAEQIEKLS